MTPNVAKNSRTKIIIKTSDGDITHYSSSQSAYEQAKAGDTIYYVPKLEKEKVKK